jgi:hypothetical protein
MIADQLLISEPTYPRSQAWGCRGRREDTLGGIRISQNGVHLSTDQMFSSPRLFQCDPKVDLINCCELPTFELNVYETY